MVHVARLVDAVMKLVWRHGGVRGDEVTHRVDERGDSPHRDHHRGERRRARSAEASRRPVSRALDAGAEEVTRVTTIDGHRYTVAPGPDRGQYVVARDKEQWWCFVRRDGDGNFVG